MARPTAEPKTRATRTLKANIPAAIEQAIAQIEQGISINSACDVAGISPLTLWRRRREDAELEQRFCEAHAAGRALRADAIAAALFAGAEKVADDPRFTTAAIFALKNLDPGNWRDRSEIDHHHGGINIQINVVPYQPKPADGAVAVAAVADDDEPVPIGVQT